MNFREMPWIVQLAYVAFFVSLVGFVGTFVMANMAANQPASIEIHVDKFTIED